MNVELWPIDKPVEYARNARNISTEAVASVAASIKEFGFKVPIIVDADGVIVSGHTRVRAAKSLSFTEIPVVVAHDLSPAQIKAFRLADNRLQQNTTWDYKLLGLELNELRNEFDFDLSLTAFEESEMRPLLAVDLSDGPPPLDSDENNAAAEPKAKTVKPSIEFTPEQFEVIGTAIFRLRDKEQDANITDGRAIELFAAEWLSGN